MQNPVLEGGNFGIEVDPDLLFLNLYRQPIAASGVYEYLSGRSLPIIDAGNPLYFAPQNNTLTGKAAEINIRYSFYKNYAPSTQTPAVYTSSAKFSTNWEAGKHYKYSIKLDPTRADEPLSLDVVTVAWEGDEQVDLETALPTATISPASSSPNAFNLGFRRPIKRRVANGLPCLK